MISESDGDIEWEKAFFNSGVIWLRTSRINWRCVVKVGLGRRAEATRDCNRQQNSIKTITLDTYHIPLQNFEYRMLHGRLLVRQTATKTRYIAQRYRLPIKGVPINDSYIRWELLTDNLTIALIPPGQCDNYNPTSYRRRSNMSRRLNLSRYVGHATTFSWKFTIACCLVVGFALGLGLGLGLDLTSGWWVVMHTHLCDCRLSLSRTVQPDSFWSSANGAT